jgi:hypothetical protein
MSKCEICGVELHGGLVDRCIKCQHISWKYEIIDIKWTGRLLADSEYIKMIKLCVKPISWE